MRVLFLLICLLISSAGQAQTPVLRPRPVTIDLANPKSSLTELSKEEKKKWKEVQKQKKKELKIKDKYFDYKLDSAQLANYKKYHDPESGSIPGVGLAKDHLKTLTSDELSQYQNELKNRYGLADTIDLTKIKDSTYLQKLNPDIRKRINDQLSDNIADYSNISTDSLRQLMNQDSLYSLNTDSLLYGQDSITTYAAKQAAGSFANQALESQAQQQLARNGNTGELSTLKQQEEMMFSSYDEMIASEQYQELMKDMPGKKAEIESAIENPSLDQNDLPIPESVFAGHEDKLASAMSAQAIIRKRPTVKEILGQFFNQDMESVKEKSTIQRFSLSGQVQFSNYDPLFIDYSPSISYAFTGKARIGTGVTGRIKIGDGPDDKANLFAYRGFLEYDIFKNIYLHGEYERTGLKVKDKQSDVESREWSGRWMLGLGTDINLPGILKGTMLILYNFDDDLANSPNPRRFQIRYGVKI